MGVPLEGPHRSQGGPSCLALQRSPLSSTLSPTSLLEKPGPTKRAPPTQKCLPRTGPQSCQVVTGVRRLAQGSQEVWASRGEELDCWVRVFPTKFTTLLFAIKVFMIITLLIQNITTFSVN